MVERDCAAVRHRAINAVLLECFANITSRTSAEHATGRVQPHFPGSDPSRMTSPSQGGAPSRHAPQPSYSGATSPSLASGFPAPAPSGPPRAGRRQYAANTAAYIAGDPAMGDAAPGGGGHGHTASMGGPSQFFSPAGNDPAPYLQSGPSYGYDQSQQPPQAPQQQGGYGGQPQQGGYGQQQAPYGGSQGGVQGLTGQFGQMGMGGPRPVQLETVNLVGHQLNPAELFNMEPPQIRLPENVRESFPCKDPTSS